MTTLPSLLRAAKAFCVEKICVTPAPVFKPVAEELFPPSPLFPQVTTLPSLLRAAKASSVEKICVTPESKPETEAIFPPELESPKATTLP